MAQLRLVFQPISSGQRRHYAYVEPFYFTRYFGDKPQTEPNIDMYRVKRLPPTLGSVSSGKIIDVSDIWQTVQLVPEYGDTADTSLSVHNVLEQPEAWYVNCFSSKFIYESVY